MKVTLRAARVNAGYTQHEVAALIHKHTMSLVKWEKGITKPSYADLVLLASIYGCDIDDFNLQIKFAESKHPDADQPKGEEKCRNLA